jgi:hypothetical protein
VSEGVSFRSTQTDILRSLPQIQEELDRAIIKARGALAALPAPPSDTPINEVSQRIFNFADDLRLRLVEGVPDADGLHQAIRPAQNDFRQAIRDTAPAFRPFEKRHAGKDFTQPRFLDHEEELMEHEDDAQFIYIDEVLKRAHEYVVRVWGWDMCADPLTQGSNP